MLNKKNRTKCLSIRFLVKKKSDGSSRDKHSVVNVKLGARLFSASMRIFGTKLWF